jgi:hypothetical protein
MSHADNQVYPEMESRLALAELHVCEHEKSAGLELDRMKHDAEQLGYGIFPIEIAAFLQSESATKSVEMADAKHNAESPVAR